MSDLISRADAIEALGEEPEVWTDTEEEWAYRNAWVEHISALKALPSATCDDCIWHVCNYNKIDWDGEDGYISRQDAIAEIKALYEWHDTVTEDRAVDHLKRLPSAEPKTASDLISRQDAIEALTDFIWVDYSTRELAQESAEMVMGQVPSAEPKTGKWVLDPNGMDWNIPAWRCSECGFVANYIGVEANGLGNNPMNWAGSKFCPQCGARITGYER